MPTGRAKTLAQRRENPLGILNYSLYRDSEASFGSPVSAKHLISPKFNEDSPGLRHYLSLLKNQERQEERAFVIEQTKKGVTIQFINGPHWVALVTPEEMTEIRALPVENRQKKLSAIIAGKSQLKGFGKLLVNNLGYGEYSDFSGDDWLIRRFGCFKAQPKKDAARTCFNLADPKSPYICQRYPQDLECQALHGLLSRSSVIPVTIVQVRSIMRRGSQLLLVVGKSAVQLRFILSPFVN